MDDDLSPGDLVSRRTAEVRFNDKTVEDVAQAASWFTTGVVGLEVIGTDGFRRVYRLKGDVLCAGSTAPHQACAYLIGAMLGWARITGAEIPEEMAPFLQDVQSAHRDGLTSRYADQEAAGAEAARVALEKQQP
jgi:hypothetical protein